MDVLRHCFTVELLQQWQDRLHRPEGLCVISDGRANLVTGTLHARLYRKVLSVNLADVLLNNLDLMLADGFLLDREVCLVESIEDLDRVWNDPLIKVGLLCADQADLIRGRFPGLFVNIVSFQEMAPGIVANYFEIIRSNRATLYCCNRERKVLPGGETLVFAEYPWEGARILMDERCPWHEQLYATRPPFLRSYDGPMRHRIATWKAESD